MKFKSKKSVVLTSILIFFGFHYAYLYSKYFKSFIAWATAHYLMKGTFREYKKLSNLELLDKEGRIVTFKRACPNCDCLEYTESVGNISSFTTTHDVEKKTGAIKSVEGKVIANITTTEKVKKTHFITTFNCTCNNCGNNFTYTKNS
jgi:hypothetical protein